MITLPLFPLLLCTLSPGRILHAFLYAFLLVEFNLQGKLFTITSNNAGNNRTLCNALFQSLYKEYSNVASLLKKPIHFHGKAS